MSRQMEREEEQLDNDLASGAITQKQYNDEMREMQRAYRAEAEEASMDAYRNEMDRW